MRKAREEQSKKMRADLLEKRKNQVNNKGKDNSFKVEIFGGNLGNDHVENAIDMSLNAQNSHRDRVI